MSGANPSQGAADGARDGDTIVLAAGIHFGHGEEGKCVAIRLARGSA